MQNILISVSHHDLTKAEKLDYDLFNAKGEIIYKKGQKIDPGFLLMIQFMKVFRKDNNIIEDKNNESLKPEIVQLVKEMLIIIAKKKEASLDIEPQTIDAKILIKFNGAIQEENIIDKITYVYVLFLLKKYAHIENDPKLKDGIITISLFNKIIDFRLKLNPVKFGEKITIQLINKENTYIPELKELYLSKENLKSFDYILEQKKGLLLIAGKEESGKTITAYSLIKSLKKSNANISTIESLIKYKFPGINQKQENSGDPTNFTNELNNIIKEKPGTLLVINIKEKMVGNAAYKAALSDHVILATIKSENIFQSLSELLNSGIEPSIIADATNAMFSQKLVRKICNNCKEKYKLTPDELQKYFIWDKNTEAFFYRGKGCSKCNKTGHSGQIPVQELLIFDDDIRKLIIDKDPLPEISGYMKNNDFKDMKYDALKKVLRGLISIEEYNKI